MTLALFAIGAGWPALFVGLLLAALVPVWVAWVWVVGWLCYTFVCVYVAC